MPVSHFPPPMEQQIPTPPGENSSLKKIKKKILTAYNVYHTISREASCEVAIYSVTKEESCAMSWAMGMKDGRNGWWRFALVNAMAKVLEANVIPNSAAHRGIPHSQSNKPQPTAGSAELFLTAN